MNYPYYTNTQQVRYYWHGEWCYGIAYHDMVIDSLYGEILSTKEIVEAGAEERIGYDDVIIERVWSDLTETIKNVDLLKNFCYNHYRK